MSHAFTVAKAENLEVVSITVAAPARVSKRKAVEETKFDELIKDLEAERLEAERLEAERLKVPPAKAVWYIRPIVQDIYLWAKQHPDMILMDQAKEKINERYWEPLRKKLIGTDTLEVRAMLKKYLDHRAQFNKSRARLNTLEERGGMPHLLSYTIDECLTRLDHVPHLTLEKKLQLSDATQCRINSEMNKKITFIKLKSIIGMEDGNGTIQSVEEGGYQNYKDLDLNPYFRNFDDYELLGYDINNHFVPALCNLTDRVWEIQMNGVDSDDDN